MPRSPVVLLCAAALLAVPAARAGDEALVWQVEALDGELLSAHAGGEPVNPASVVKVATALFALTVLGADHRYETVFSLAGTLEAESGTLRGDLVVGGGDDPDFHFENALLVAWRLNELGVRRVSGDLVLDERFWIGWEHGSEGREKDPDKRLTEMGERLRRALDPELWGDLERRNWQGWRERSPDLSPEPPRVAVGGTIRRREEPPPPARLVHRSNELHTILKRFLAYSNNDVERVADPLGGAPALEGFLRARLGEPLDGLSLETTSGLGINRMAPATVVAVLRALAARLAEGGLSPGDLLPMPGCDPGSLEHALPHWQSGPRAAAMACKTGTLIHDDGGVAALAGFLYAREGTALYMVAAPRSGPRIEAARGDIETWVNGIAARLAGPSARECGAPVEPAEFDARVVDVSGLAQRSSRSATTGR